MAKENWDSRPAGDELPDRLVASAWQATADLHPQGSGTPCYRVVFKTLRLAVQNATLTWSNLHVHFGSGTVARGGAFVDGSIPSREPGLSILPEYAQWRQVDHATEYEPIGRVDMHIQAWEDETPSLFYIECFVHTEATSPHEIIQEGRRGLSSIATVIDLSLGKRVLGALLAEEAGEHFEDGHFNRQVGTEHFCWEPQLEVVGLSHDDLQGWSRSVIDPWMQRPERDRLLFSLSSRWYQAARVEPSRSFAFLQYWFAIEVLAMPNSTNVGPLRIVVADSTGSGESEWREFVGKLFGLRGRLVHGSTDEVSESQIRAVSALAEVVLAAFLGLGVTHQADELRLARVDFLNVDGGD